MRIRDNSSTAVRRLVKKQVLCGNLCRFSLIKHIHDILTEDQESVAAQLRYFPRMLP